MFVHIAGDATPAHSGKSRKNMPRHAYLLVHEMSQWKTVPKSRDGHYDSYNVNLEKSLATAAAADAVLLLPHRDV